MSVSDLERWHPTLKNIHQFIDLYGRLMVLLSIGLAGFSIAAYHVDNALELLELTSRTE